MKSKVLNALCKKAYNRLNRTREWAASNAQYSTQASNSLLPRTLGSDADVVTGSFLNGTGDVRALGIPAESQQYEVHPLVRESAVARLLVEGMSHVSCFIFLSVHFS